MLSDRRPILLANARIVDPSRDFDIVGDLLIADGLIREAKKGIGAGGVPEGTDVVDCGGEVVAPGLIDMRAFVGEPGAEHRESIATATAAAAVGGVTTLSASRDAPGGRSGGGRLSSSAAPATMAGSACCPWPRSPRVLKGRRSPRSACCARRARPPSPTASALDPQQPGAAPRHDLCARFRRPHRPFSGRPRPRRLRRDECGRAGGAARPFRRAARGRGHRARPRHSPRAHDRRALLRRAHFHHAGAGGHRQAKAEGLPVSAASPSIISRSTRTTSAPIAPSSSSSRRCGARRSGWLSSRRSPAA